MHVVSQHKRSTIIKAAFCRLPPKEEWEKLKHHEPADKVTPPTETDNWKEACRIWLGRQLLWHLLGVSAAEADIIGIQYQENGRPFIPGYPDFNISHAGDRVVVACTSLGLIGLDIELKNSISVGQFTYNFSEEQMNSILEDEDPVTEFYRLWTVKESVVKLTGRDLSEVLDQLETDFTTATLGDESWFVEKLFIDQMHVCHLVTDHPIKECVTEEITFQKLFKVRYLDTPRM